MEERELLQAILSELQSFKKETAERFEKLEAGQAKLEAGQAKLEAELTEVKTDLTAVKKDVRKICWQVDVLYEWVDRLDLKVKRIGEDAS